MWSTSPEITSPGRVRPVVTARTPGHSAGGYSLVELLAVLTLVGILAFATLYWSDPRYTAVQGAREDLVTALQRAAATALARDSASNPVRLVASATSISVTEAGVAQTQSGIAYPLNLPNGVTLSPQATLEYDKLGRTTATTFTLSDGSTSATVSVTAGGSAD